MQLRRACLIGTVALTLGVGALASRPVYAPLAARAHCVKQRFQDLGREGWSPAERLVFSLLLTGAHQAPAPQCTPAPAHT